MASGDVVVEIRGIMPPGANYATLDTRTGGSTPAEALPILAFDGAAIEYVDLLCRLSEKYAGGGLTFVLPYLMASATSGNVRLGVAIRALPDDAEDVDAAHTYDFNNVTDAVPSAAGEIGYPTVAFTDGADMDNWAAGQLAIVRIRRDPTHTDDDNATDLGLILGGVTGKES